MQEQEFFNKLEEQLQKININLNTNQKQQFYNYMNLLLEWNQKINLTAITDPNEIINKHFIDSLTVLQYANNNSKVIDVGTGAGFPGIPMKIANNTLEVVLLDSLNKRLNFLNEVIEKNNLEKIETIHYRAEEAGQDKKYREKFDIAISRAVAPLNILVEYLLPFVKLGGKCICMKGSNVAEELEISKKAIKILGGRVEKIEELLLPNSDINHSIVIIKKIEQTKKQYPRKPGTPGKSPII